MKKWWETKRLGDVCGFQNGFAFKSSTFRQTGCPILRISNIQDDRVDSEKLVFFDPEDYSENLDRYRIVQGDLLIAMSGATTGKVGFNTEQTVFYLNQRVGKFEPSPKLNKRFLFYFLSTKVEENLRISAGAAQPNLSTDQIKGFVLPLPSPSEQQRIVDVLDEAFAGLATAQANAEKNLQNARALFESHLQSVFTHRGEGWIEKTLGDLCEITSALVDPREKRFLDLPHIGGANIKAITGELFDLKTAREERLISGKFVFDDATVLYSKIRPYLMKVARPDFRGLCSADIYPLTPKQGQVDRNYLFHLLLSSNFTLYANIGSARAGMPKVNREHLFAYRACIPPFSKQAELAAQLDSLSVETQRLTQLYKQKLVALAALKKSLLHQAFNGEL